MNLDRIIEGRSDEELGAEVGSLKEQIDAMQKTLNGMQHNAINTKPNLTQDKKDNETAAELLRQMKDFRNQAQREQHRSQEQMQQALDQAMNALGRMQEQIQTNEILSQMSGLIEQAEQQLSQINHNTLHSQNHK